MDFLDQYATQYQMLGGREQLSPSRPANYMDLWTDLKGLFLYSYLIEMFSIQVNQLNKHRK